METENFNKYMIFFKEQPLKEKQNIIIEQLKMLTTLTNTMCKEVNVDNKVIFNEELLEIQKENYTENDFADVLIVLINSIQNSLCDFDNRLTEILEKIS